MSSHNDLSHSFEDDNISYMTITSGDRQSSAIIGERQERLHEWLKADEITALYEKFIKHPEQLLNYAEFRQELERMNISFSDLEYNRLFLKVNQNRDFKIDWNEFVSYLIYGFQEDDPSKEKESLILPISTAPLVRKSEHRSPICAITLLKTTADDEVPEGDDENKQGNVATDGASSDSAGMWLTASREGQIRFWTTTLEALRTGVSESIHLKMPTWILAMQALSDVCIVCTASTERELRFHETMASTFSLRLVIRSMPFAVCCMSYSYHPQGKVHSKLLLGDFGGNVRILEFSPFLRGPFQSRPGAVFVDVYWSDVLKGKLPLLIPREFINLHNEMIQQVSYSMRMNALFSAAEYRNTKKYRGRCPGLIVVTSSSGDEKTNFRIPLGVTTFFVDERHNAVVTGGPDTFVRIWDVYIPQQPSGILTGHNGGIVMVFVQPDESKVYSIDYQKVIKVWHLTEFTLLQSFGDLVNLIPHAEMDLCYSYHVQSRELVVGGRKLISIKCSPRIRVDLTDGNTHAAPVSVVLYNRLFRNVVTCGLDSYIIIWDPWSGRRKLIMKNCHTKMMYGETIDIEITAACFDPLEQFLLTGARDGSIKIWNYNNAVCVRNMSLRAEHEVTAVIWVIERILAVGWDQQVTEFNDVEGREYSDPKKWPRFHSDDITCADVKLGEGVVTATYSGEIIFWKLETGQPYRRYSVAEPAKFIELKHNQETMDMPRRETVEVPDHMNVTRYVRRSISSSIRALHQKLSLDDPTDSGRDSGGRLGSVTKVILSRVMASEDGPEEEMVESARTRQHLIPMSVQAVLFLQTRPMTKEHGSVLVALDTGIIQVYSHHQRGGYIGKFNSIHKAGDCVLTMSTDRKNRYLFTGTAFGYVKIWYIQNFCVPAVDKVQVCMPMLRLQFIFLRKERFMTRAKRMVRHQPEPLLVSSYKGHLKAVTSTVYIDLPKILISGSYDFSCRLWTLGGRYLGTLGTPLPWQRLSPFDSVDESQFTRMPPDIKKVASSTTMKVITGVQEDPIKLRATASADRELGERSDEEQATGGRLYAQPLREPILGKHFYLPGKSAAEQRIELDTSQAGLIPVFTHLKIHEATDMGRPASPPAIRRIGNEQYMQFYEPHGDEKEEEAMPADMESVAFTVGLANCVLPKPQQTHKREEDDEKDASKA